MTRDAHALLDRVNETLARPRPPEEERWRHMPEAPAQPAQAPAQASADQWLDVVARGIGLALGDATRAMMDSIAGLEARIAELEKRHD